MLKVYFLFAFIWFNNVLKEMFSISFYLRNYLGNKISLLMWLFVIIMIKLTQWSANLSPSHSYFSFQIICGRLWGSLAVEDHLRSILGIICGLSIICSTVQYSLHLGLQLALTHLKRKFPFFWRPPWSH